MWESLFSWVASATVAVTVLFVVALGTRRLSLARADRGRLRVDERVHPLALAVIDEDDPDLPELSDADVRAMGAIVGRYARRVTGTSRARVAAFFERRGDVGREIRKLLARQAWRRAAAAYTLGDFGSSRAVPELSASLGDRDRDVRAAAARSLGRLGAPEATRPLVHALAERTVPHAVTGHALLEIGPAALPELKALLEATVETTSVGIATRSIAVELIGLLGSLVDAPTVSRQLRDPSADVRAAAARALGRLGADEEAAALRAALEDRIPFVRAAAAEALGAIRDGEAVPALLLQAQSDGFEPAQAAARALATIAPRELQAAAAAPDASPHVVEAADLAATYA